jgi:cysteinyl-tRNA synthetase
MSKSSGKFLTLQSLIDDGYDPLAYRYLCLTAHYRSELTYSEEALTGAGNALAKIYELKARTNAGESEGLSDEQYAQARAAVVEALNDDLNLPRAVAALHEAKSYRLWKEFDGVLALDIERRSRDVLPTPGDESDLPDPVRALMAERDAARKAKEWSRSDALRAEIEGLGYIVGDSPAGTTVKKKLI